MDEEEKDKTKELEFEKNKAHKILKNITEGFKECKNILYPLD